MGNSVNRLGCVRDLLFISFAGYFAQGALYDTGSLLSQSFLLIIMSISAFYFIKTLLVKNKRSLFYNTWTAFLLLNVFGYLFTGEFSNSLQFGMFKGILLGSLPFYPFYYFTQRGVLKSKHLIRFFILMLPVAMLSYFFNAKEILMERASANEKLVNNMAYNFVALIPFLFLIKKRKILSIAAMALLMFLIIQGAKRGAVVTGAIGLFLFLYYQLRTVDRRNRVRGYILTFIGIGALSYYAYYFYENNEYLISRMQQMEAGGGSGRVVIYASIFNGWIKSDSFSHLVFGYGFAASWGFAGNFAHNDWLELLSNFGLLGVVIYAILFYAAVKYVLNKKWNIDKRLLMLTIVLTWFTISLFSMGYTNQSDAYFRAILLAYLIGQPQNFSIKKFINKNI